MASCSPLQLFQPVNFQDEYTYSRQLNPLILTITRALVRDAAIGIMINTETITLSVTIIESGKK
ncbi:hypothetical protein [Alkalibacterium indicireducens]|uniref:hypothetical protein n=1 Tax=Alkalibacterium indicireducens TaxID=398758 RepID=UPI0031F72760